MSIKDLHQAAGDNRRPLIKHWCNSTGYWGSLHHWGKQQSRMGDGSKSRAQLAYDLSACQIYQKITNNGIASQQRCPIAGWVVRWSEAVVQGELGEHMWNENKVFCINYFTYVNAHSEDIRANWNILNEIEQKRSRLLSCSWRWRVIRMKLKMRSHRNAGFKRAKTESFLGEPFKNGRFSHLRGLIGWFLPL